MAIKLKFYEESDNYSDLVLLNNGVVFDSARITSAVFNVEGSVFASEGGGEVLSFPHRVVHNRDEVNGIRLNLGHSSTLLNFELGVTHRAKFVVFTAEFPNGLIWDDTILVTVSSNSNRDVVKVSDEVVEAINVRGRLSDDNIPTTIARLDDIPPPLIPGNNITIINNEISAVLTALVNNLVSDSDTSALTAAQGKELLRQIVDGLSTKQPLLTAGYNIAIEGDVISSTSGSGGGGSGLSRTQAIKLLQILPHIDVTAGTVGEFVPSRDINLTLYDIDDAAYSSAGFQQASSGFLPERDAPVALIAHVVQHREAFFAEDTYYQIRLGVVGGPLSVIYDLHPTNATLELPPPARIGVRYHFGVDNHSFAQLPAGRLRYEVYSREISGRQIGLDSSVSLADLSLAKGKLTQALQGIIDANTAKVGITSQQATDLATNTAKVGITSQQATDLATNTAKVGITPEQATDIEDSKRGSQSRQLVLTNTELHKTRAFLPHYEEVYLGQSDFIASNLSLRIYNITDEVIVQTIDNAQTGRFDHHTAPFALIVYVPNNPAVNREYEIRLSTDNVNFNISYRVNGATPQKPIGGVNYYHFGHNLDEYIALPADRLYYSVWQRYVGNLEIQLDSNVMLADRVVHLRNLDQTLQDRVTPFHGLGSASIIRPLAANQAGVLNNKITANKALIDANKGLIATNKALIDTNKGLIATNTAKVGITPEQATDLTASKGTTQAVDSFITPLYPYLSIDSDTSEIYNFDLEGNRITINRINSANNGHWHSLAVHGEWAYTVDDHFHHFWKLHIPTNTLIEVTGYTFNGHIHGLAWNTLEDRLECVVSIGTDNAVTVRILDTDTGEVTKLYDVQLGTRPNVVGISTAQIGLAIIGRFYYITFTRIGAYDYELRFTPTRGTLARAHVVYLTPPTVSVPVAALWTVDNQIFCIAGRVVYSIDAAAAAAATARVTHGTLPEGNYRGADYQANLVTISRPPDYVTRERVSMVHNEVLTETAQRLATDVELQSEITAIAAKTDHLSLRQEHTNDWKYVSHPRIRAIRMAKYLFDDDPRTDITNEWQDILEHDLQAQPALNTRYWFPNRGGSHSELPGRKAVLVSGTLSFDASVATEALILSFDFNVVSWEQEIVDKPLLKFGNSEIVTWRGNNVGLTVRRGHNDAFDHTRTDKVYFAHLGSDLLGTGYDSDGDPVTTAGEVLFDIGTYRNPVFVEITFFLEGDNQGVATSNRRGSDTTTRFTNTIRGGSPAFSVTYTHQRIGNKEAIGIRVTNPGFVYQVRLYREVETTQSFAAGYVYVPLDGGLVDPDVQVSNFHNEKVNVHHAQGNKAIVVFQRYRENDISDDPEYSAVIIINNVVQRIPLKSTSTHLALSQQYLTIGNSSVAISKVQAIRSSQWLQTADVQFLYDNADTNLGLYVQGSDTNDLTLGGNFFADNTDSVFSYKFDPPLTRGFSSGFTDTASAANSRKVPGLEECDIYRVHFALPFIGGRADATTAIVTFELQPEDHDFEVKQPNSSHTSQGSTAGTTHRISFKTVNGSLLLRGIRTNFGSNPGTTIIGIDTIKFKSTTTL